MKTSFCVTPSATDRWLRHLRTVLACFGISLLLLGCGNTPIQPERENFDGEQFRNLVPTRQKSLWDLLRWRMARKVVGDWQDIDIPEYGGERMTFVQGDELLVTFVNHSTVLLQTAGVNILTDPIWSERCSPFQFAGPRRHHAAGIPFEDLPPIDAVVISHNHYDHMDLPSLKRLHDRDQPVFLVGLANAPLLQEAGISSGILELDWWQSHELKPGVRIHGVPAQHWSTRTRFDINQMLWMAYVIESPGGPVFFAGDTGAGPHFDMIRERFGPMRFSLLPIGAFLPRWFMKDNHLSPTDALVAHRQLASRESMAIHFGTFELGDDGQFHARDELLALLDAAGVSDQEFWVPQIGIPRVVGPVVAGTGVATGSRQPAREARSLSQSADFVAIPVTSRIATGRPYAGRFSSSSMAARTLSGTGAFWLVR